MDMKTSSMDVTMDGLHKSAIIYRDNSARFIYVCFHCGCTFTEIDETLQHIESHFQLANVVVEQSFVEDSVQDCEDHSFDCFAIQSFATDETVEIKTEVLDNKKYALEDISDLARSEPSSDDIQRQYRCKVCDSIHPSKFLIRLHAMRIHIREPMKCYLCKTSFTRKSNFETHLAKHITKGDVDWKSVVDGIKTKAEIDWSAYEAEVKTEDKVNEPNNKVKEEKLTIPSSEVAPSSLTVRPRKTKRRETKRRACSRQYRCHKCPLICRYTKALRTHFVTHHDNKLSDACRCKECDCFYRNPLELRIHVLEVHLMTTTFTCTVCDLPFHCSKSKQFEEHLEQHKDGSTESKRWIDIRDGINHPNDVDYAKYEEIVFFTEEQHSCEFCTQRFHLKSNLDEHTKSVHCGQRRLQCGQCDSVFTTPKYYYAHQFEHQRVGAIITERDDNVLLANLNTCIDERIAYDEDECNEQSYRCLVCYVTFNLHYDVRCHVRERHVYKMFPPPMEPRKEFVCDLCGLRLRTKSALKNHLLIHTNTKTHACTICGKKFRQNADRKIHERQHTGEKPYQCHQCGKGFISKGLLTSHRKVHEDTKYPCPICERSFNLPSGYRKHIQTHNTDRSFKCTVCPKSFNTKIYLSKHMTIHSSKQYQCRFCECKFNTSDGLRQHQRHKHKFAA